ncbi:hypothetical protein [Nocardiopsis sp. FR26]|uniref:hypothetical protein n=1 Tax=Nocardiopsis sp. FR26 TaxID=2605987 RepID=UPI0013597C59|nr:hypothetical protein [Nocardiopsis sp. FR26]
MSALDRVLEDLIAGRWILTLEDTADGGTEVVAYRPLGWTGPNPHERIAAPDHDQMRAALVRRQHEGDHVPPSTLTPTRPPTPAPAPRPAVPPPSTPTAAKCGMCNGEGGRWETTDGSTPGKNISRWVPCSGCNGTGEK